MKLASILPVKNNNRIYENDYAMLLTHLALQGYYAPRNPHERNCYTILDNSLIEEGKAIDLSTVMDMADALQVDEIVLPDVFMDAYETIYAVEDAVNFIRRKGPWNRTYKLMAVCQGSSYTTFNQCFDRLSRIPEIHCIGIPKAVNRFMPGGRPSIEALWQNSTKCIHLLGCAFTLKELTEYAFPAKIRSCDTCIPALISQTTNDAWRQRPVKTIDLLNDEINESNYNNIIHILKQRRLI